jgi:hypothetical protein
MTGRPFPSTESPSPLGAINTGRPPRREQRLTAHLLGAILVVVQMCCVMRFGAHRGWGRTDRGQVLGLVAAHNRCSPLRQCFDAIRRLLDPCRTCDPAGCPVVHPTPPETGMSGWHYKSDLDRTCFHFICSYVRLRRTIVAINS